MSFCSRLLALCLQTRHNTVGDFHFETHDGLFCLADLFFISFEMMYVTDVCQKVIVMVAVLYLNTRWECCLIL